MGTRSAYIDLVRKSMSTLKIAVLVLIAGLSIAATGIGLTIAKANGVFETTPASTYTRGPASKYHEPAALKRVHARYVRQLDANAPAMDLCVTAGLAAEVALQTEDSSYEFWLTTRKGICRKAGL
jgi:hypothetical protein